MKRVYFFLAAFLSVVLAHGQSDSVMFNLEWQKQSALVPALSSVYDGYDRPYLYVASRNGGLQVFDVSSPDTGIVVKTMAASVFNNLEVMNVCQRGNYLFLALGNFFGNAVQAPGLAIVNVSNPTTAALAGIWDYGSVQKGTTYVAVEGNYAYLSGMSKGIYILNISDTANIFLEAEYLPDPNWPKNNPSAVETPNARGMAVRGDILYLCYDAGGIRVINIADKQHPHEVSHYINTAATNKQQAFNHIYLKGDTAFAGVDYCGVEVLDISDTNQIVQLAWWNPYNCESAGNVWTNSPGHINEIRYDSAHQLLFASAGASEIVAIDVSDAAHPRQAGLYAPTNTQAVWGITIHGQEVFAHYINSFVPYFSDWQGLKRFTWVKTPTGITFNENIETRQLYPNPAGELLMMTDADYDSYVTVYTIGGETVMRATLNGQKLNTGTLGPGIYIVEFSKNRQSLYGKFIKD